MSLIDKFTKLTERLTLKECIDRICENIVVSDYKIQNLEKQLKKTNELLRRVYNDIEMVHLNDHKCIDTYVTPILFRRQLGEDIFNWLQSHDEEFKSIVIKRQKRWRVRQKRNERECYNCRFFGKYEGKCLGTKLVHYDICKNYRRKLNDKID